MNVFVRGLIRFIKLLRFNRSLIFKFLRHPLLITCVAGFITCFVGYKISYQYQIRQLRYQQEFEIFKERFYGGMNLLENISLSASERVMGMQRVIWVIKGTSYGDLNAVWDDYYKSVLSWNIKQIVFKMKLMQYVGDPLLTEVLMNNEDSRASLYENKSPQSLHGRFLRAHLIVKKLYQCAQKKCPDEQKKELIVSAEKETFDLSFAIEKFHEQFIESIYSTMEAWQSKMFRVNRLEKGTIP